MTKSTRRFLSALALSASLLSGVSQSAWAAPVTAPQPPAAIAQAGGETAPPSSSKPEAPPPNASSTTTGSEVRLEPIMWLPTATARVKVGDPLFRNTLSVGGTVTPEQALPNLHISFAGRIEGRCERWGGFGEIFYLSSSQPAKILGKGGTLGSQLTMGQVAGFYRTNQGSVPIDLIAGVRIASLENKLDFSSAQFVELGGKGFNISRGNTDLYPIVGARVTFPLSQKLSFQAYGDYGGFGIGNSLQTWRAQGMFGYDMNASTRLLVGYNAVNYSSSTGRDTATVRKNATFYGPALGMSFKL